MREDDRKMMSLRERNSPRGLSPPVLSGAMKSERWTMK